jgi:hypothetical protein
MVRGLAFVIGLLVISFALGGSSMLASAMNKATKERSLVVSMIDTTGNNGTLNLKDVAAAAATKFAHLDVNHDGVLDARELAGIVTRREFISADHDHDGTISKAEYLALAKKMFVAADVDHDGTLDVDDLSTQQGVDLVALLAY